MKLIDENQAQKNEINKKFENASYQLAEVKEYMKKFEIEKGKIEVETEKIDHELREFKARTNDLNDQITKKFKNLKVCLKEFHQFYELDLIEQNIDNDEFLETNENQSK